MERFEKSKTGFCRAKFSSYQASSREFKKLVSDCMELNPDGSRAVVLTTFRDPIQHCLFHIHQTCNKGLSKRPPEVLEACVVCSFDSHTEVWYKHVNDTIGSISDAAQISRLEIDSVKVLTMDTRDIDPFFESLQSASLPHNVTIPELEVRNKQKTAHCNFAMTAAMFKALGQATDVFRNLSLGI